MYVNVKVAVVHLLHHQTSVKKIRIVFIINSFIWSGITEIATTTTK